MKHGGWPYLGRLNAVTNFASALKRAANAMTRAVISVHVIDPPLFAARTMRDG